ncbi:MAG: glutamate-5-semialdehyde dehydrogenase [Thainema sp.]
MTTDPNSSLIRLLRQAQDGFQDLINLESADRKQMIRLMAEAVLAAQDNILEANTLDLEASREMAVPDLILDWLKLTPERLQLAASFLERLANLPDPLRYSYSPRPLQEGQLCCQIVPLGVVALIYEALPELSAIASGLCCFTGNSLVLKGGSEASHTNEIIVQAIQIALSEAGYPISGITLMPAEQTSTIRSLVTQDSGLNLVIPYGRPSLVQQVMRQSAVPILRAAMGNCYLYWSSTGNLDLVRWMILDSHQSEPDPVNAIEKVLIARNHNPSTLTMVWNALQDKGYELRGDQILVNEFPELILAEDDEWSQPYLEKVIAFKVVDDIDEAIRWINNHSSSHADSIVTESYSESRQFSMQIQSASVYVNTSPRFYRNPPDSNAIALGMSNQRSPHRGLIDIAALTTTKQVIQG